MPDRPKQTRIQEGKVPGPEVTRCFSTLGCAELDLGGVLALAERHGIAAVELRALAGTVDLPGHLSDHWGTPERLAARLAASPLRVASLGTSLRLIGNTAEDRDAFLSYVPWAEACGGATLRAFDGGTSGDAREIEQALATLAWWRALRAARGWTADLVVETHDAFANPDALARFVAAAPDCALLWDTHHTWRKGATGPAETWAVVRPHVRHLHVKDSMVRADAKLGYAYVLPGEGEFPMAALLGALRTSGYGGLLSLEWERLWHPELPALDAALVSAARQGWW